MKQSARGVPNIAALKKHPENTHSSKVYSRHRRHGNVFFEKDILFLAPPKQVSFLTISNENIFFKPQGTWLHSIVIPNKGLELALGRVFFWYSCWPTTTNFSNHKIIWLFWIKDMHSCLWKLQNILFTLIKYIIQPSHELILTLS